ncbi:AcrR family transcriptional regulator [Streptacidiphilus sp. MAP12-20]|uniref:TetR/AcrR family transcriptional regulator n=1 Tax=Streptacidiphilus sp. MAP12-20 TaxID=3156299 RepID=UPI00351760B9
MDIERGTEESDCGKVELGKREQNRRRTHVALIRAATQLFRENGFESTTVRDIAAAAGVGERTFFRYFPSKESLVLQQVRDLVPLLADEIRARPASADPLRALRDAVLELARRHGSSPAVLFAAPGPLRLDRDGLGSGRGDRFLLQDVEEAVAAAFLDRMTAASSASSGAVGADLRLRAFVLARAGVGALREIRFTYGGLPEDERTTVEVPDLVHRAFAVLGVGDQ